MVEAPAVRSVSRSLRVASSLLLLSGPAQALAGFGALVELPLSFPPAAVAVIPGPPGARSEILVVAKDRPLIAGHILTDEGILVETQTFRPPDRCAAIVQGDFNGDGKREFTLLSAGGTRIHSYLRHPAGWISRRLAPGVRATKLLSVDIDADGITDLICYGKSMAGGVVYPGTRQGLGDSSYVVLPELSIGDAVATDMNGDRVPDLLVADWLGNSMTLFLGLDGVTFTEAVKVDVPGEPLEVEIAQASDGVPAVLAALVGDGTLVRTFSIRSGGEITRATDLSLDPPGTGLRLADTDGDHRTEVFAPTRSGMYHSEWSRSGGFDPWRTYGMSVEAGGLSLQDVDGDRRRDIVTVDWTRRKLVVCASATATGSPSSPWPDAYVTPGEPEAVVFADMNLDGNKDLVVACRRPPTVAVLESDGRGGFAMERMVSIPEDVGGLVAACERPGARRTIVTSHPGRNVFGILSFDEAGIPVETQTIPTGDRPRILAAFRDTSNSLQVLFLTGPESRGSTLAWLDELPGGQFVERSPGMAPAKHIFQAVAHGRWNTQPMIAALVREGDGGGIYAWTGRTAPPSAQPFGAVSGSIRLMGCQLNSEGNLTVFLSSEPPGNEIGSAVFDAATGTWAQPVWRGGLTPDPSSTSIASDLNGDGSMDLLFADRESGMIVMLPGQVNGIAQDPRPVLPLKGTRLLAIGDPGDGRRDLYVAREGSSSIAVVRGGLKP